MPVLAAAERHALVRAVAIAEGARPGTAPNPAVGCVLLREGRIVGEGVTQPAGGHHAEAAALAAAGELAEGATACVTLEPCAHQGRTPPCADALADAGVRRVVFAHADPNGVAAGGAEHLRHRGIDVAGPEDVGPSIHGAVAGQLEGFLTVVATGRPHVTLKVAQTLDGTTHAPDGARWITGAAARAAVHRWRASVDAVLVGSGTVLADDPRLDVRHVPCTVQPRPVVLDRRLRTPPGAQVVGRGAVVVCAGAPDAGAAGALERAGAQVVAVDAAGDDWLPAALRAVAATGVRNLLAEPGTTLGRALVAAGLVDRLVVHVADAGEGPPRLAVDVGPATGARTERCGGAGPDLILHLTPSREAR